MTSGYHKKKRHEKKKIPTGHLAIKLLKRLWSYVPKAWHATINFLKYLITILGKALSILWGFILRFVIYPLVRLHKRIVVKLKQWKQLYHKSWKATIKKHLDTGVKFAKDYSIIIFLYGFLVNYIFWFFLNARLNIFSIVAYGLSVYFVKYEIVSIIVKIRGPRSAPGRFSGGEK